MSLTSIGQEITIYGGLLLVIGGVIGNGMNILVFSSVGTYRRTPCSFYFLISSMTNIVFLLVNLVTRIVSTGLMIDLTGRSIIWCKTRLFLIGVFSLTSFTCSSLATIDQFLVTSSNVNLRRCSNIKWAHRIVLITILLTCLHGFPCFLYLNISPITNTCIITNSTYILYTSFYTLLLTCLIPITIMILFGYLTYRNIQLRRVLLRQYADRQLTRMTLIQVILVVLCMPPYGIIIAYNLITSSMIKDSDRLIKESFALTIFTLLTYFYYVVC